ncbi:MAG: hypothetical protein R2710_02080 [Acidimicrobiales bacterium]
MPPAAQTRFGGDVNKVLVSIGGRPVIAYSLATFDRMLSGSTPS